jgi:hypothetical protein
MVRMIDFAGRRVEGEDQKDACDIMIHEVRTRRCFGWKRLVFVFTEPKQRGSLFCMAQMNYNWLRLLIDWYGSG